MPPDDLSRQAELLPDRPDFVLEQGADGFHQRKSKVFGQTADVVVALDVRGTFSPAGLDDVGIEGALNEEVDVLSLGDDLSRRLLEHADELLADDLALLLGILDAF